MNIDEEIKHAKDNIRSVMSEMRWRMDSLEMSLRRDIPMNKFGELQGVSAKLEASVGYLAALQDIKKGRSNAGQ